MTIPYKIMTTDHLPKVRWQKRKYLRFWFWHYRWDIQFKAGFRTTGRKWCGFFCPFYGQRMARARNYHILGFLHFTDNNRNGVDRKDDRLEITKLVWNYKDKLFKILQPFRTFRNRNHCEIQGKGIIQTVHPENANVSASKCWKYATLQDIHVTWMFTLVKTKGGTTSDSNT